ncbi:hypothetical protein [Angustibacter aerolatus]
MSTPAADDVRAELTALGLPAAWLPRHSSADAAGVLLSVLHRVAAEAPTRLEGTTVVVGDVTEGRKIADQLLALTGAHPRCVLTVDDLDDVDADALLVAVRGVLLDHGAAVVLVPAAATRAAARSAGRLVATFAALPGVRTLLAGVVAHRDAGVTAEWLTALQAPGCVVSRLAAHGVEESTAPLRLLGLGTQVAWVDARPATVGAWAAPCLDRLHR